MMGENLDVHTRWDGETMLSFDVYVGDVVANKGDSHVCIWQYGGGVLSSMSENLCLWTR